ncbi:MAG: HlyD family efflux transporter periplasmic adaptor subunit [Eudoraea sp.]|nr:HlyD family efflux transporter periplasmic adaptor subunit [Eudoraea sp.]
MKQIFPKEIIENTSEVHQFKHTNRSKIIYSIILVTLIGAILSLPFITATVYSSARGIIKPNKERVGLYVINSGRIVYSDIQYNKKVLKGDTLLVIDNNGIDDRIDLSNYQMEEAKLFLDDLSLLLDRNPVKINDLKSSKYQRAHIEYSQKLIELGVKFVKVKRDYDRHKILHEKGVIAISEFEDKKFEYDIAEGSISQFKKQQLTTWQVDYTEYANRFKEMKSQEDQLLKSKSRFIVTAPINGTLMNVNPQELGSFITTGAQLGEISPDTSLLVECYVNPSDIGLLKKDTKINFQVDAFNYNQWGIATGSIIEIGRDIEILNNVPVFKVRCKMDQKHLELKNGFIGNLKKGMTLNANFELTERSLFDLLYDKLDDWLNPSRNELAELIY